LKLKDIQNWLFEHQWVFGPNYLDGSREELDRIGNQIDFVLQRYDTFYDIIELKLPSAKLFIGTGEKKSQKRLSRKFKISGEVKDAISQLFGYLEEFELDKTNKFYEDPKKDMYKPKGIIVIGRSQGNEKRALKTVNAYLHGIEIYTYDDLLNSAENFVRLIKGKKRR
jgi:hypothetical protein